MKKMLVVLEVDESKLEELDTNIEKELGWLQESGIAVSKIEEYQEEYMVIHYCPYEKEFLTKEEIMNSYPTEIRSEEEFYEAVEKGGVDGLCEIEKITE